MFAEPDAVAANSLLLLPPILRRSPGEWQSHGEYSRTRMKAVTE
jgi:hypothetical protein